MVIFPSPLNRRLHQRVKSRRTCAAITSVVACAVLSGCPEQEPSPPLGPVPTDQEFIEGAASALEGWQTGVYSAAPSFMSVAAAMDASDFFGHLNSNNTSREVRALFIQLNEYVDRFNSVVVDRLENGNLNPSSSDGEVTLVATPDADLLTEHWHVVVDGNERGIQTNLELSVSFTESFGASVLSSDMVHLQSKRLISAHISGEITGEAATLRFGGDEAANLVLPEGLTLIYVLESLSVEMRIMAPGGLTFEVPFSVIHHDSEVTFSGHLRLSADDIEFVVPGSVPDSPREKGAEFRFERLTNLTIERDGKIASAGVFADNQVSVSLGELPAPVYFNFTPETGVEFAAGSTSADLPVSVTTAVSSGNRFEVIRKIVPPTSDTGATVLVDFLGDQGSLSMNVDPGEPTLEIPLDPRQTPPAAVALSNAHGQSLTYDASGAGAVFDTAGAEVGQISAGEVTLEGVPALVLPPLRP